MHAKESRDVMNLHPAGKSRQAAESLLPQSQSPPGKEIQIFFQSLSTSRESINSNCCACAEGSPHAPNAAPDLRGVATERAGNCCGIFLNLVSYENKVPVIHVCLSVCLSYPITLNSFFLADLNQISQRGRSLKDN